MALPSGEAAITAAKADTVAVGVAVAHIAGTLAAVAARVTITVVALLTAAGRVKASAPRAGAQAA